MGRRERGRRSFAFRLVTLLALAAVALLALVACGDNHPYSTVSPRTSNADKIQSLYKVVFWGSLVVFIGVQFGLLYTVLRYRFRQGDPRPPQIHGNRRLEILWTVIPAFVLLVIFIPTVSTLYDFDRNAKDDPKKLVVEVYGKQWWWEIHYPTLGPNGNALVTANEVHLPEGKDVQFRLISNNVIHSFWVPQLTGKMDVVPGHVNKLGVRAPGRGTYYGECAEFCGEEHAWMRFKVIVQPQADFDAWVKGWTAGPTQASAQAGGTGDVAKAPAAFALCLGCHRVNGMTKNPSGGEIGPLPTGLNAATTSGPNLSLVGCRTVLAAGLLTNTPENLTTWLTDPGAVKPGNFMATQIKKGTLKPEQIKQLVAYLESLKPEGGCPPLPTDNLNEPYTSATPAP